MQFQGYKIDDYHVIAELYDENNKSYYCIITFHNKFESEELTRDENGNCYYIEKYDIDNIWEEILI